MEANYWLQNRLSESINNLKPPESVKIPSLLSNYYDGIRVCYWFYDWTTNNSA